LIFFSN